MDRDRHISVRALLTRKLAIPLLASLIVRLASFSSSSAEDATSVTADINAVHDTFNATSSTCSTCTRTSYALSSAFAAFANFHAKPFGCVGGVTFGGGLPGDCRGLLMLLGEQTIT